LLRECHLSKASLHVQPDALINLIAKNLKEVSLSSDNRTQFVKTKTAFILLGSLYEWLSSNSNSDLLPQFLSKLIVPANKDQECQLYQFFMLFDKALQKENWHFQDFSEFYAFSVTSNSEKYYFQGILDILVEILTLVKHQMTAKYTDSGALYESSILVSEFLYLQRKLDLHFKNKLTGFDFGSGYFSVHFLDKYLSWINVHAHYDENVVGYLTFLFTRLEELCNLSVENQSFVQLVHNSKDPEILLKKHYLCLRAFKSSIIQILEENNLIIGSTVLYPFITKLEASIVISNLKGSPSAGEVPRLVNQKVHENCVSIFVSVLGLLKVQFYNPSGVTTTIITEELIEQMGQVIMNYVQDKKGFLESCYIMFEAIRVAGLKDRCLDLIPDVIQKYFTQVLPDLECYSSEHVDTLWKIPVWESTFLLFDPHLYPEDPHEREVCQNLALRFYEGMNKNIKELGKEFVRHDFTNESVLRNELVMLKIKSSTHQIGGILKKSLPLIHSIVNDLLARKEHSKLELLYKEAESIFLNPIFHINEFYRLDFLRTIKGAYSANTAFVSGTIDRVYETFIRITKQLSEVVVKNKDNVRFMETLGNLMGNSQNLLLNFEKKEIESCEILGPQVISCLLTLEGLYHFLGSLYEGYEAGLGKQVLGVFVENFGAMLSLAHIVDSFNNGRFLKGKPEGDQAGERTLERNIYTTLFTESLCTEYIMEQAEISGSLLRDLEAFLTENLQSEATNLEQWGRQITAFDMVNSFLLDNESASTAKIMGYKGILKTVLDWIVQVFKNYSQLPPSNLDVLAALDAKISEFIAKTWTVIQVLYEEKAPAEEEDPLHKTLLEGIAQKEEVFYGFICEALKADLSYYETLHLESLALQSLFHAMYEFVQRIKQYGGSSSMEEGAPNTSTNLNDKEFFETVQKNMNYGLVGAIKSPYLFSLILSNQDCLDILNLAETTVDISQTLHDLVEIAHQYVQQGEKETPRNSLTKKNNQCCVDLNLEFLSEKQRGLRVLEFLCHVLSLVSKMPFDFDPTTLGLSEVSYGLELDFLCESNLEIFQQGDQKSLIEALKFCYNSLYTNTLRTAIKKNVYKVTLDPLKDLTKKNLELNERALKAILHQFSLEKSIKEVLNFRLFKKDAFEPYLFMVSLWWVNAKDCLKNLPDEPGVFQRMIENAKSEQNMELMVYFLTLYMLNAFPEKEIIQIIVKGLVYLDRSGQLLLEDSRVDIYQALSSQNLIQTMQENFSIDGVWLSLIGEEEKTNSYGVVNGVSSYEYLIKNINGVSKKVLNILLETLLKAFDNYVREIHNGRKSKVDKVLRPLWILTILLGRFPELVPYVTSYRFDINGYEFKDLSKEVIGRHIEGEMNFFEFLVRVFMWYFPGCNPIQEVICNPQKPIVIRLGEKDLLLEEMMVQMYLEEMLNFMNEDLRLNQEKIFEDSPFGLWRWEVCLMKAYDIVVTSRTAIPEELLQNYIIFLFKSLGICKTKTSFSAGKLIKSIGKLLEGITMSMVVNQFNKGLKKVDKKDLKLNLQEIASTKEGLRLALYIARKARDSDGTEVVEDVSKILIEEEKALKTDVATVPSGENVQVKKTGGEQEDTKVLVKEFKASTEKILKENNVQEFNSILFGGSTLRKCHWSKEDNLTGGALAKTRVEGFYENLSKAQGVVLNLCREHIVHKKVAKNKFALFFELQESSDSTEIFNKSCLEMLYSGWGSDYASEKTWQKLESDALDIAVGNLQVGQTDNQNLLDGGFKEALRRELLAGYAEVQEAEKPVVAIQEIVAPAPAAVDSRKEEDLISQAARLLTKEGSLLKKNLYLWLEDITMKQVEGGLLNQKEQKYQVEEYLRRLGKIERIATCYFLNGAMVDSLPEDHKEEVIQAKRRLVQILGNCLPEEAKAQNGDIEDDDYEEYISDSMISDDEEERSKGSKGKGERNDDYASDEDEARDKKQTTEIPPVPVIIVKEPTEIEVEPAPTPVKETDEMEEESLLGLKKLAPLDRKNGVTDLDKAERESIDDQEAREINGLVYTREEEEEVKDLYDKVLGKAGVGEIISEGIIRISEEAILELIKFFLEETREESAMKDKEDIGNVRTYYREIDTLMINPYNQDGLLHILTFLINCPQDCLLIPSLDHYNFKYFLTNVLGFLAYYVQINPKSLFKYIPQEVIQRHSSLLNRLVKTQELPTRISQLQDSPFFNRIFALASLQESQSYKPLFESVITLLLSVSKISKTLNDPLPINITDLKYLKPLILSCENFASTKLLAKISKLLRILIQKSDCVATVLEIEKGLIQESVPELLVYLKEKNKVLALATSKLTEQNGLIPLEDSQGVARELLEGVVKVDKLKEVLRCMDYNLEIGGITEEVLSFYASLGSLDDFKEMLKIMGQILIGFKKVENITLFSVIDIYVHGFIYGFSVLKQSAVNERLLGEYEKVMEGIKEFICQVFKTNIGSVIKDSRLVEKIKTSPLSKVLDFEFKKSLLERHFQEAQIANKAFYIPCILMRYFYSNSLNHSTIEKKSYIGGCDKIYRCA